MQKQRIFQMDYALHYCMKLWLSQLNVMITKKICLLNILKIQWRKIIILSRKLQLSTIKKQKKKEVLGIHVSKTSNQFNRKKDTKIGIELTLKMTSFQNILTKFASKIKESWLINSKIISMNLILNKLKEKYKFTKLIKDWLT